MVRVIPEEICLTLVVLVSVVISHRAVSAVLVALALNGMPHTVPGWEAAFLGMDPYR